MALNNQNNSTRYISPEDLPQAIRVRDYYGVITTISFQELKNHEKNIIEDNMFNGEENGFSEEEMTIYSKKAWAEWNNLKNKLRENPRMILMLDPQTERYVPYVRNNRKETAK